MSQSSEYLSYSLGSLEAIEEADEPMTGQNTPAISRKTSEQPLLPPTTTSSSTVSPLVNHAGLRHSSSSSSLGSLEKTPRGSIILPGGVKVDAASAPRRPSITDIPKLIPSPKVTRAQLVYTSDAGASSDSEAEERHDSHLRPSTVSIPTMSKSPSGISITVETPDDEAFDSSLSHSSLMPVIQADVPKVPFDAMQDAVLAEEEGIEHARLKPLSLSHYSASVQSLHDHGVDDLMMRANCLLDDDAGSSGMLYVVCFICGRPAALLPALLPACLSVCLSVCVFLAVCLDAGQSSVCSLACLYLCVCFMLVEWSLHPLFVRICYTYKTKCLSVCLYHRK